MRPKRDRALCEEKVNKWNTVCLFIILCGCYRFSYIIINNFFLFVLNYYASDGCGMIKKVAINVESSLSF